MDAALQRLESADTSHFSGAVPDYRTGTIDLYTTGGTNSTGLPTNAAMAQAVTSLSGRVRVHLARHSQAELVALEQKVSSDVSWWATLGTKWTVTMPAADGSALEIDVPNLTPATAAAIASHYGAGNVTTVNIASVAPLSRAADSSAWNGGDLINTTFSFNGNHSYSCTSGITMHNAQNYFLLTAAHCSPQGAVYTNGSTTIGASSNWSSTYDSQLVKVSTSALDWRGGTAGSNPSGQTARLDDHMYDQVCDSGSFNGEICGVQVIGLNGQESICPPWYGGTCYTVSGITRAQRTDRTVAGEGDSGGPVYAPQANGTLAPHGMISGGGNLVVCPSTSLTAGQTVCSNTVYYVSIGHILSAYGLTVNGT